MSNKPKEAPAHRRDRLLVERLESAEFDQLTGVLILKVRPATPQGERCRQVRIELRPEAACQFLHLLKAVETEIGVVIGEHVAARAVH